MRDEEVKLFTHVPIVRKWIQRPRSHISFSVEISLAGKLLEISFFRWTFNLNYSICFIVSCVSFLKGMMDRENTRSIVAIGHY